MAAKAIRHVPKQRMAMREDAVQAQSVSDTAHLARLSGAIRMARNGRHSVGTTRPSGSPRSGAPYRPGTTSTATPTPRCFRRSANCAPRAQNGHSPRTSRSLRAARCRRSPARRTPPQAPRQPPRPPPPGQPRPTRQPAESVRSGHSGAPACRSGSIARSSGSRWHDREPRCRSRPRCACPPAGVPVRPGRPAPSRIRQPRL